LDEPTKHIKFIKADMYGTVEMAYSLPDEASADIGKVKVESDGSDIVFIAWTHDTELMTRVFGFNWSSHTVYFYNKMYDANTLHLS
jgi:hypothetical protein